MSTNVNQFGKRGTEESFVDNILSENFFNMRLRLLATSSFKWSGLPEGIPAEFIENAMYDIGALAMVDDPKHGIVLCKFTQSDVNMYGEYLKYNLYADNGYNGDFNKKDVVLLKNNNYSYPTIALANHYIDKLFTLDTTMLTNIKQQKISKIVMCDENKKMTVQNVLMQQEGGVVYVLGNKSLGDVEVKSIDVTTPFIADQLYEINTKIWGELLDMMGINNANTDKKERMITDEVNANNDLLQLSTDVFLETRKRFCEQANAKFGLNMSVERTGGENDVLSTSEIYGSTGESDRE